MCDAIQKLSNTYFKDLINKVEYFEGKSDCPELYLAFIYKETSLKRNLRGGLNVSYKINENDFLEEICNPDKNNKDYITYNNHYITHSNRYTYG